MANLPPDHNEFALGAEAAQNNMNGWIEEEEEEGADPLNLPPPASDSESEIEFEEAEAEAAPIPPSPIPIDHEPEAEAATIGTGRLAPLTRLFANTQVWTGSSSSSVDVGHDPEDLTLSHIRSDLDALHRKVRQIEEDDVRAENK
ncbi:hypothetical protein Tco_0810946 [Tanacetum coccineum]